MYSAAFSPRRWFQQGAAIMMFLVLYLGVLPAQVTVAEDFQALRISQPEKQIQAPDFALVTTSGETLRLSDLQGKFVLLNFWTTW